jgi:hypothetical protein
MREEHDERQLRVATGRGKDTVYKAKFELVASVPSPSEFLSSRWSGLEELIAGVDWAMDI